MMAGAERTRCHMGQSRGVTHGRCGLLTLLLPAAAARPI